MTRHPLLVALALGALAGCASVPELRQPSLDLPAASQPAPFIAADWWRIYGDPVLDAMIDEALAHNADLRLAALRIEEARAYLGLAQANLYPEVSAGAGAARDRRTEVGAMPAPSNPVSNTFTVDLRAFYDNDLRFLEQF